VNALNQLPMAALAVMANLDRLAKAEKVAFVRANPLAGLVGSTFGPLG
jgi:hypothetical protein